MVNSPTERQTRNTRKGKDFMVASGFSGTEFNERTRVWYGFASARRMEYIEHVTDIDQSQSRVAKMASRVT